MMNNFSEKQNLMIILSIIKNKFHIEFDENTPDIKNQALLGLCFKMQAYELAYLVLEIRRKFCIEITENDIILQGLYTINDFIKIINKNQSSSQDRNKLFLGGGTDVKTISSL